MTFLTDSEMKIVFQEGNNGDWNLQTWHLPKASASILLRVSQWRAKFPNAGPEEIAKQIEVQRRRETIRGSDALGRLLQQHKDLTLPLMGSATMYNEGHFYFLEMFSARDIINGSFQVPRDGSPPEGQVGQWMHQIYRLIKTRISSDIKLAL